MSIPRVFDSAALCFGVKFWESISEEELSVLQLPACSVLLGHFWLFVLKERLRLVQTNHGESLLPTSSDPPCCFSEIAAGKAAAAGQGEWEEEEMLSPALEMLHLCVWDWLTLPHLGFAPTPWSSLHDRFRPKGRQRKLWKDEGRWEHDKFREDEQAPKTRQELIALYGYDIRSAHNPDDIKPRRMRKPR